MTWQLMSNGFSGFFCPGGQAGWGGGYGPGMMFGGGWFGGIFMIIFWIVLILAGVALVRWMMGKGSFGAGPCGGGNSPSSRPGRSLDILKERYAAGEITKAEFESMKRDLEA